MNKPRVLYIFKHDPFGIGGGATASRNFFYAFLQVYQGYDFDVLVAEELLEKIPQELKVCCHFIGVRKRTRASRLCSMFTGIMHRYQDVGKYYLQRRCYDFCIFDHNCIAGSLVDYAKKLGTKSVVIHHNYERDYFRDNNGLLLRCLFLGHVKRNERTAYKRCDYNIFLTQEDQSQFYSSYGMSNGMSLVRYIFETSEDIRRKPHVTNSCSTFTLVITGSLDNPQNIDGMTYFVRELYEKLPPSCHVIIAGKNPSMQMVKLLEKYANIELIANPPQMDDVIMRADVFLCPTRLGSGIKVRITDGLRHGLPVIAHRVSARGYDDFINEGFLFPFDSAEEFGKQIKGVLKELETDKDFSKRLNAFYYNQNSFASSVQALKDFIGVVPA